MPSDKIQVLQNQRRQGIQSSKKKVVINFPKSGCKPLKLTINSIAIGRVERKKYCYQDVLGRCVRYVEDITEVP